MITLEEFRVRCARDTAEDIVDEVLLKDDAVHVSADNRAYLLERLATAFGIKQSCIQLWVVGSAKLGFSIIEKRKDGQVLARYRPFSPISDIDTAIVSPDLFRLIWDELSSYAHGQPWMPWNSGRLGDYMVYGWLRPDHFPSGGRVRRCDDWWDQFRRFSAEPRFGRRSVRGGLFHSIPDLRRYLRRSVLECIHAEQEQL
jgi:hypothetical protein